MHHIYDCIVIGGGISGLSCAYELKKKGLDVIVVEAGSVGGRMENIQVDDFHLDLGAGFLMNTYKEIIRMSQELDIKLIDMPGIDKLGIVKPNQKVKDAAELHLSVKTKIKILITAITNIHNIFTHNIEDIESLINQDEELSEWLEKRLPHEFTEELVNPISHNLFFYGTDNFSKNLFIALMRYMIRSKFMNFENGIGELCRKLSQQYPTIENTRIEQIVEKDGKVELTFRKGLLKRHLKAKKVVVAIQGNRVLKLLKNPNRNQKEFFKNIKYSSTIKLFATTEDPLFEEFQRIYFTKHKALASVNLMDKKDGKTLVSIGLQHELAEKMLNEGWSDNRIINYVREIDPTLKPMQFLHVQRWSSALPIFNVKHLNNISNLADKIHTENLSFCGDYFLGPFTEGAALSGIKAAKRLLESFK